MSKIRACCISIDIKDSENIININKILGKFDILLKKLNKEYKSDLLIPFEFRRGDEIIGVLVSFLSGYKIYETINAFCETEDISLYFGLGLGTIDTGLVVKDLDEINGSAIISAFRARDKFLKDKEYMKEYIWKSPNNAQLYVFSNEDIPYKLINYQVYQVQEHLNQRTEIQKQAIMLKEKDPEMTNAKLGKILNYEKNHAQNARSVLVNGKYDEYIEMKNILYSLFEYVEKNYRY